MKAAQLSAVGVVLPLLFSLAPAAEALPRALAPLQLRFASRAARAHTPGGGIRLLPMRKGVTLGSWRYRTYVAHRRELIALVQGARRGWPAGGAATDCWLSRPSSELAQVKRSEPSTSRLRQSSSSEDWDSRLKSDELVWVDRAVDGRLEHSGAGLDSAELQKAESIDQLG